MASATPTGHAEETQLVSAMSGYELSDADRRGTEQVISSLTDLGLPPDDPALLQAAVTYAHELPRGLREQLVAQRLREDAGALLVRGLAIADSELGPTPGDWRHRPQGATTRHDAYLLLLTSLLGDVFGWSTQQNGRIIQDVLPIKSDELDQISSNSAVPLSCHVEDGWSEYRPDYVALLCLRNPDRAVTRWVDVSRLPVAAADRALLADPVFLIRSDYSHSQQHNDVSSATAAAFEQVTGHEQLMPILSGDLADPYVRYDADFLDTPVSGPHADALGRLRDLIESSLTDVVLTPGDLLVMDNFRAVHGRAPFRARYDGTDRWLRRVYVTRDLRKSSAMRRGVTGRLLFA